MKKVLSYLIPGIAAFCAVIPPIDFRITPPLAYWPLIITFAGFLGMYLLFLNVPLGIKFAALAGLMSCFTSSVPYISFNAYVSIVACCYFYVGAIKMDSWIPTTKALMALYVLNGLFVAAQLFSQDQLLNFGLDHTVCFGVIGQHMQAASFFVILAALLIQVHPIFFALPIVGALYCNSSWGLFCSAIGLWVYFPSKRWRIGALFLMIGFGIMGYVTRKFSGNLFHEAGRLHIWDRTLDLLAQKPWQGWGPGTYKIIFPALSGVETIPWKTAHNDWLQLLFELGWPIFFIITVHTVYLFDRIIETRNPALLAGATMIVCNMVVHFPLRMIECVLLVLLFLAYCQKKEEDLNEPPSFFNL